MILPKQRLILVVLSLLIPFCASAKVLLVSVGISDYPGTSNDLNLPEKDARTITWLYSKNSSLQYCQLLNSDATRSRIISAMNKVYALAGPDDIVVFFYSGHGYSGGFYVYDGPLDYSEIRRSMSRSKSRNKMIFADACFSGQMRTERHSSPQSSMAAAKKANVMLFLSSRSGEVSMERRGMQNGFFTTYLQKGLRGGADANKDRVITARELYDYVHTNVVSISNGRQHPVMWGRFSDNMPVMKW